MSIDLRVLQLVKQGCSQGEQTWSSVRDLVHIPWLFLEPKGLLDYGPYLKVSSVGA